MKRRSYLWKIALFDMGIIEFGPVGVFVAFFYLSDFLTAALSLGVATVVALALSLVVNKRIPWFALFSGLITITTSLVTYIYDAPWVLIVKDTVYYYAFAVLLGIGFWKKVHILEKFFGHIFAISDRAWMILERRWFVFFIIAGSLNEIVRMVLTVEQWVMYKQVVLAVFIVFGLLQFLVSRTYRLPEGDAWGFRKNTSTHVVS
jgi:intracellular septation protein